MSVIYKDLVVWQAAMSLVERCYLASSAFPAVERYGLASQMRRAAVSIPSNIAEGACRHSDSVYANHVAIALGSQAELETLIELARRLAYLKRGEADALNVDCVRVGRLLNGLLRSIRR
jgi:four helix bundle protein